MKRDNKRNNKNIPLLYAEKYKECLPFPSQFQAALQRDTRTGYILPLVPTPQINQELLSNQCINPFYFLPLTIVILDNHGFFCVFQLLDDLDPF